MCLRGTRRPWFERLCSRSCKIDVPQRSLVKSVADKVLENIERTEHLVSLVPANRLEWIPEFPANLPKGNDLGRLLGHLLDCLSGFCAAFYKAFPVELADFVEIRSIVVNEFCGPEDAREKIQVYAKHIERGFRQCTDVDLARRIPTVFVTDGEALLTILLGNLEHLINHKYQVFFYLKLLGTPVTSRDLYKWRGSADPGNG
jgi:DinB superfamily